VEIAGVRGEKGGSVLERSGIAALLKAVVVRGRNENGDA
jgi:hypothetical protein